jgi:hypothetical protein
MKKTNAKQPMIIKTQQINFLYFSSIPKSRAVSFTPRKRDPITPINTMISTMITTGLKKLPIVCSSNWNLPSPLPSPRSVSSRTDWGEGGVRGKRSFGPAGRAEIQLPGGSLIHKNLSFQFFYHRPGKQGKTALDTPGNVILKNDFALLSRLILFKFFLYELKTMLRAGFFTNAASSTGLVSKKELIAVFFTVWVDH